MLGNCIKHMMRSRWIFRSFFDMWYAIIWRPMVILQNMAEEEDIQSVTLTHVMMAWIMWQSNRESKRGVLNVIRTALFDVKNVMLPYMWSVLLNITLNSSPNLAPSDYHLFGFVKDQLHGHRYETTEAIQKAVRQCLRMAGTEFYRRRIFKLPERWEKCVQSSGDYAEK
jgi:hypothetical protein